MKVAYFDSFSGASGGMLLGALLDAGLPLEALLADLDRLALGPYRVAAHRVTIHGLTGTRVDVQVSAESHPARNLPVVEAIIQGSALAQRPKERSLAVFRRIARVEAAVHGTDVDRVHFHELGAVDGLVDIVGFVCALERLEVEEVYCSILPVGGGMVRTKHGLLPVPTPTTLALLAEVQAPAVPGPAMAELVTTTGAALLSEFARFERPSMAIQAVGCGFGIKDSGYANALRVWLGERMPLPMDFDRDEVVELACNLDNVTGELLGYVIDRLMAAGALDVWFTPIQMKKNRPAVLLSVLSPIDRADTLSELMLRETPTLGVRRQVLTRQKAGREISTVETAWGSVRVKAKILHGTIVSIAPEYEDCARLAHEAGVPLADVMDEARRVATVTRIF